jgi:hypothetical protein
MDIKTLANCHDSVAQVYNKADSLLQGELSDEAYEIVVSLRQLAIVVQKLILEVRLNG